MIMAIGLTVALRSGVFGSPESDLDGASGGLANDLDLARSEAIARARRVFFEFNLGDKAGATQGYRATLEPLPGREDSFEDDEFLLTLQEWKALPRSIRIESVATGDNDPWTSGDFALTIQPDGTMQSSLIRLYAPELAPDRGSAAGWACIQITGLLGQARVLNRYVETEFPTDEDFK